ncbi:MAG TPA: HTTM domain-containing protein [Caldilineaceae bacterium]|nr:HTTM domain-containing protein [Caldilineaceae bacterium]
MQNNRRIVHPQYNFFQADYWFGEVDSRPLSPFRICFGALLLKNALYSIPLAQLFYSDEGIVPRAQFWADPTQLSSAHFSLLNYLPTTWMAILFFVVWAIISLSFLVGYQTRWMAVLTFLWKLSILHRNPFPLSGADHVMTVLSFWMTFLLLNHYYSVDGWLARHRGQAASATMPHTTYAFPLRVIQIQVALIYVLTSYYKWHG